MLKIEWESPFKVKHEGIMQWRHEWIIPIELRNGFFNWWRINKYKFLGDGFSVTKKGEDWYLTETKLNTSQFRKFNTNTPEKVPPPDDNFTLEPLPVKQIEGLRPWQVDAVGLITSALQQWGCAIDGSDLGVGKCHSKGTKIRMYDGSLKNVEDIIVGDLLMGDDSTPRKVLSLATGFDEMYEIVPTNGGVSWGCNKEHILVLQYTARKQIKEMSVKDYLNAYKSKVPNWKLVRTSVEYPKKNISVDPYLIGLWIGDGTYNSLSITVHKNDIPIIDYLYSYECGKNPSVRVYKSKDRENSNCNTYYLRGIKKGINPLWNRFKNYGFGKDREKFIPKDYLINCVRYRKLLLAGLIDSDGWKDKNGCYGIITKWKQLQLDIIELARSLGYKVKSSERVCKNNNFKMDGNVYFKVQISGAHDLPILLNRKQSSERKQRKSVLISGFKIVPKGVGQYFGFTLDGNHRYLLEDFTITHNTYVACAVARELGYNIAIVCPKAVMESWRRVIKNHFKMEDKLVGIINYELLIRGKKDSNIASFVKNRKTCREEFTWKLPKKTLIVWDESQKLKNWKTKNSKTCMAAFKEGYSMLFCSATMATNPLELRTVGSCLKLFKGAKQYYEWAYAHGVEKGRFGLEFDKDDERNEKFLKKLNKDIFGKRGVRLCRDSIPNFPKSEIIAECYNMDEQDIKTINQINEEMSKELKALEKREKKDGDSELTILLRARQKTELVKVPLFIDMIEEGLEQGMSVVLFVNFTETINAISQRLNTKCIFDGKTADKIRQQNVDDFQADKERVILVNIQSGGAGLSLHDINGKYPRLSLISPSYSAVCMRQSTGRVWRENSKSKSIQKIVFVAGTVEEEVCKNVQAKLDNLDILNDGDMSYGTQKNKIE